MNLSNLRSLLRHVVQGIVTAAWLTWLGLPLCGQVDIITTVAGAGSGTGGDGFAATLAGVPGPRDVAIDNNTGTLYISSAGSIRRVSPSGIIDTLAVIPVPTIGGFPISSQSFTSGITYRSGFVYVAQNSSLGGGRVIRVDPQGRTFVFVEGGTIGFNFGEYVGLTMDTGGDLFIADSARHRVLRRSTTGALTVFAGRTGVNAFGGDGGISTSASLNAPAGLAMDGEENLYIADRGNHRIRRVAPDGTITTFAGSGGPGGGFAGDGGLAVEARLNSPSGVVVDGQGNLYISDTANSRIRRVDPSGVITTVAGSGNRADCFASTCYSGDGSFAVAARLSQGVAGLAVDDSGNLYIADGANQRVRRVTFNAPANQLPPPLIRSTAGIGVANGASFQREIASGSWVTIFGQHLAPLVAGRIWRNSEIVNGKLPATLEGVSVRFNGKPGYLYFVGPGQLNVLTPSEMPNGIVEVEVETPSGIAKTNADVRSVAPALFRTVAGPISTIYAAAVHQDGTIVGHPSLIRGSRPARTGDIISVYGTGFGPTSPARPAGEIIEPARLAFPFTARIQTNRVQSGFGGLVGPGLYQFNITMPTVSGTYVFVEIEVQGQSTEFRMILAVN